MLMPIVSVTVVGLLAGLAGATVTGERNQSLIRGVVTSWIGFFAGALVGLAIDTAAGTGIWLALFGHAGAIAAASAVLFVRRPVR